MATIDLTRDTFEDTVLDSDTIFVYFSAEWCEHCKVFTPIFEETSEKHADIVFAKVDVDAERELSAEIEVPAMPALIGFREGIVVYRSTGGPSLEDFDGIITQVNALDMVEVRRQADELENAQQ